MMCAISNGTSSTMPVLQVRGRGVRKQIIMFPHPRPRHDHGPCQPCRIISGAALECTPVTTTSLVLGQFFPRKPCINLGVFSLFFSWTAFTSGRHSITILYYSIVSLSVRTRVSYHYQWMASDVRVAASEWNSSRPGQPSQTQFSKTCLKWLIKRRACWCQRTTHIVCIWPWLKETWQRQAFHSPQSIQCQWQWGCPSQPQSSDRCHHPILAGLVRWEKKQDSCKGATQSKSRQLVLQGDSMCCVCVFLRVVYKCILLHIQQGIRWAWPACNSAHASPACSCQSLRGASVSSAFAELRRSRDQRKLANSTAKPGGKIRAQ